jgi:hypothetical protein
LLLLLAYAIIDPLANSIEVSVSKERLLMKARELLRGVNACDTCRSRIFTDIRINEIVNEEQLLARIEQLKKRMALR